RAAAAGSGPAVGASIAKYTTTATATGGGAGAGGGAVAGAAETRVITAGGGQAVEFTLAPGGVILGAQGSLGALSPTSQLVRIVAEQTSNSLLIRATDADWALIQTILRGVNP
ncbi:MAG TPA: hypothetical protein VMH39_12685, partial [Gemmatimonadaceae bacterium]|nr:hypothetical protein [Gemmatimonadaceae bacterium]